MFCNLFIRKKFAHSICKKRACQVADSQVLSKHNLKLSNPRDILRVSYCKEGKCHFDAWPGVEESSEKNPRKILSLSNAMLHDQHFFSVGIMNL